MVGFILTGCTDFTRYRTGKVLKEGKKRVTYPDIAAGGTKKDEILIIPRFGIDYGLGKGYEAGWRINSTSVSGEIRKQLLYEEKCKVNFAVESKLSIGSVSYCNYGGTFSFNNPHYIFGNTQEYIGVRHNIYFDSHDETKRMQLIKEKFRNDSNIQLTVGREFFSDDTFRIYIEFNGYKYIEKSDKEKNEILVVSIGTTYEY